MGDLATEEYRAAAIPEAPLVAVVTRATNGDGLGDTLRSLQQQTFPRWCWSIVAGDEGAVTSALADGDPRIAVGPSPELADATVVVRLEPGDVLEPTTLEKWVWALEAHPDWAFVDAVVVHPADANAAPRLSASSRAALVEPQLAFARAAVRRDIWEQVGGNRARTDDLLGRWEFWFRVATLRRWGGSVPEPLVQARAESAILAQAAKAAARLRRHHTRLWLGDRPRLQLDSGTPNEWLPDTLPFANDQAAAGRGLLLVVPWLELGGADKFNLDLIRYLEGAGWHVTVASTLRDGSTWFGEFASLTSDIFQLAEFLPRRDHPRFLRYLIESRGIDTVLLSNSEAGYRLLPYLRAHFPQTTFVDYCHSDTPDWNHGGYPRLSVEYQDQLDLTVVASEYLRRWMVEHGADGSRIEVCYIGVDADQFAPVAGRRAEVRKELGIAPEKRVVLFVGRISQDKQPHVLGRTMAAVAHGKPDAAFLIAGDGPDRDWLETYVARQGIDEQVMILGSVAHADLPKLLDASDVFFLPSRWEGIALTAYEAMASGLPVVVADVGGQAELVTPDCGVLVPRSDEQAEARSYADAICALLADDDRRAAMGHAARERVETGFRLDALGPRMVTLLQSAADYAQTQPRQALTLGFGRAVATSAVEYARVLEYAATSRGALLSWSESSRLRRKAMFLMLRVGSLGYRWGLAHGFTWMTPLRHRLRRALLRAAG